MKGERGFSLIELLIVVVIMGIAATIAIPNLLAARRAANEGSAISSLRSTHSGQLTFQATVGGGNYAADYAELSTAIILDSVLASGNKSGYFFTMEHAPFNSGAPSRFAAQASAATTSGLGRSGERAFGISTDGIMRFNIPTTTGVSAAPCTTTNGILGNCAEVMGQ